MNRQEPTQLPLFSNEWPQWKSLPSHAQNSIVDGLSQMLLQRLQQQPVGHRVTTETSTSTENDDVS
jgi:hypothetical protein